MSRILDIVVYGQPFPKERPRTFRNKSTGKSVTITPQKTLDAEGRIAIEAIKHFQGAPCTGPVIITIWFRREGQVGADLDNMAKLVKDALNTIVYADDKQVVEAHLYVKRGYKKGEGRTRIVVETTDDEQDSAVWEF